MRYSDSEAIIQKIKTSIYADFYFIVIFEN